MRFLKTFFGILGVALVVLLIVTGGAVLTILLDRKLGEPLGALIVGGGMMVIFSALLAFILTRD